MKLHISDSLGLPLEAVTQTFCILAKKGAGKSYCASVMAEEMLSAGQQIVAVDPTGAWFGLRSDFPIVIIGGEHADIPLEEGAGEVVARAIVENRFSAVLDLSLLRKGQMIRFMITFAETLYRLNREPLHLFVDEADAMAPQGRSGYGVEENRMLGAMEDLVRRGRRRGIGCTLISQRPAVLAKSVLTQAEVLIALRLIHPRDIDAVMEWVNVQADAAEAKKMVDSLPSLGIGDAWFWSPGWLDVFKHIHIRQRHTFDSGATPKPGQKQKTPKHMKAVDIKALGEQIQATVEKAKAEDPRELRKKISVLESEVRRMQSAKPRKGEPAVVSAASPKAISQAVAARDHQWSDRDASWGNLVREWQSEALAGLQGVSEAVSNAAKALKARKMVAPPRPESSNGAVVTDVTGYTPPVTSVHLPRPPSASGRSSGGGQTRILAALAEHLNGLDVVRLGLLANIVHTSGTFDTYVSRLKNEGLIEGSKNLLKITSAGVAGRPSGIPIPQFGDQLITFWRSQLGGGMLRIFDVLVGVHPSSLTKEQVGEGASLACNSGTFDTYVSRLRNRGLICRVEGSLRVSDNLYEPTRT